MPPCPTETTRRKFRRDAILGTRKLYSTRSRFSTASPSPAVLERGTGGEVNFPAFNNAPADSEVASTNGAILVGEGLCALPLCCASERLNEQINIENRNHNANRPRHDLHPARMGNSPYTPLSLNPSPTQAGRGTSRRTPLSPRIRGGKGSGDRGAIDQRPKVNG